MTSDPASTTTALRLRPDRTQRLEALLLGAGPHLEPVLDIGTAPNGDLLLVLPAPAVRLTELLEAPGSLTAGEAVTVLVPLAQALDRLHEAGVAHGGIRAAAVVLDPDGSPAWTAPVAPTLLRKVGATPFATRTAEDVAAYRALCRALLEPVGARVPETDRLDELAAALFGIARPEPVRLARPSAPSPIGTPARLLPAAAVPVAAPPRQPASAALATLLQHLRTVRVRAWVALGGAVALLVGALTLLPSGGAAPAAPAARAPASRTAAPSSSAAVSRPATPTAGAGRTVTAGAAIPALLAERERCLSTGGEACLRRVDAIDSPVLAADLQAVQAGVEAVRIDRARVRVTAVSGGTALATAGEATVLAIRDRDGWRLRDVVAEPPGTR